jgi:hypothetical protein
LQEIFRSLAGVLARGSKSHVKRFPREFQEIPRALAKTFQEVSKRIPRDSKSS